MIGPFTRATPTYRAAQALNQASGPALTVYPTQRPWLAWAKVAGAALVGVVGLASLVVLIVGLTNP